MVIQQYVELPAARLPGSVNGQTGLHFGTDVFLFSGRAVGLQSRVSNDPIINVGRKGMLLPVFVSGTGELGR